MFTAQGAQMPTRQIGDKGTNNILNTQEKQKKVYLQLLFSCSITHRVDKRWISGR